jgi:hypothetical protein
MSDNTANSEQDSTTGSTRLPTIEELRAADPRTRSNLLYAIQDAVERVRLLNQLTAREAADMMMVQMVDDLNERVDRDIHRQDPTPNPAPEEGGAKKEL